MPPFQLVTMGQLIADFANEMFASNAYRLPEARYGAQLTGGAGRVPAPAVREEPAPNAMAAERIRRLKKTISSSATAVPPLLATAQFDLRTAPR